MYIKKPLLPTPCSLLFVLCSLLIALFSLSCQTAPRTPDAVQEEANFIPLNPGALAYVFVDTKNARPILNKIGLMGMDDKQVKQILDRTQSTVVAIYSPYDARAYHLSAWGRYPARWGKIAFDSSKDWEKMISAATGADYWYSPAGQLSIALDANQAFVSAIKANSVTDTNIDPFPAASGTRIPEHFNEFRKGAIVSCWLEEPAALIAEKLEEVGIGIVFPAEQLFISLYPSPQAEKNSEPLYEATLTMQFSSARLARNITGILDFTRNRIATSINESESINAGFAAMLSFFFVNSPQHDGNFLIIKTNPLSSEDIALLFSTFSL